MRAATLLSAMLVCLAMANTAMADTKPVVIKMDLGGWMPTYEARAKRWGQEGRKIIIDGDCRSACTFYLWTKYHLDVCVTPNARLMFHMPLWRTGEGRHDVEATTERAEWSQSKWRAILAEYPRAIAAKIQTVPNPSKIKDARVYRTISGKALTGLVKPCAD